MRTDLHFQQVSDETVGHKFKLEIVAVLRRLVVYLFPCHLQDRKTIQDPRFRLRAVAVTQMVEHWNTYIFL